MANGNSKVLTAEQEMKLRQPIEEHVGEIQAKINSLREDGTDQVVSLQNKIDGSGEIRAGQRASGKARSQSFRRNWRRRKR